MEIRPLWSRRARNTIYESVRHRGYDYRRNGLLVKLLPRIVTQTENEYTKNILRSIDYIFIWLMDYIDYLKNFKNPNYKT